MITIICSVYNGEKWLEDYLNTVNCQYLEKFEIIIVDANSTDNSVEIINDHVFREDIANKLIKLPTRVNIYEAWNVAIKQARGEYVLNYNVDDRLLPNALSTYREMIKVNPDVDLFYTSWFDCSDEHYSIISRIHRPPRFSHEALLQNCFIGPFPLVRRSVFDAVGFFDTNYCISGDYEMWLRMSKHGRKFKSSPCVIGYYYRNPDGVSTKDTKQRWIDQIKQDTRMRDMYR